MHNLKFNCKIKKYILTASLFTESVQDGRSIPYPLNEQTHSTESSPFQRSYTRSGIESSMKDGAQARSSIKHFDMSSPLRMLRRSCPQSPRVPLNQTAGQQG